MMGRLLCLFGFHDLRARVWPIALRLAPLEIDALACERCGRVFLTRRKGRR